MDDQAKTPAVGSVWSYKERSYRVVQVDGLKVKDPSDANWHDGIGYENADEENGLIFVRRLDDFCKKFVEVPAGE